MPFNFTKAWDFTPSIMCPNSQDVLDVVYQYKLLGSIITSDGKWKENTKYITKRGTSKLWMLRRLKLLGADRDILLEMYRLHVRSLLESSVPLWHSGLSISDSDKLERVQKMAFSIILGSRYKSYKNALTILNEISLQDRRLKLCLKFARKCAKNPLHSDLFQKLNNRRPKTRSKLIFNEKFCRTKRYFNSAVPFLTRLLNKCGTK